MKKSALAQIKDFIAANKDKGLKRVETQADAVNTVRKEMGLSPGAEVVVDGIPLVALGEREGLLAMAVVYAYIRWCVAMTEEDTASLFKSVGTEELRALIPIIMDQHMDDHGFEDPIDKMDHQNVADLKDAVRDLGFDNSAI